MPNRTEYFIPGLYQIGRRDTWPIIIKNIALKNDKTPRPVPGELSVGLFLIVIVDEHEEFP